MQTQYYNTDRWALSGHGLNARGVERLPMEYIISRSHQLQAMGSAQNHRAKPAGGQQGHHVHSAILSMILATPLYPKRWQVRYAEKYELILIRHWATDAAISKA